MRSRREGEANMVRAWSSDRSPEPPRRLIPRPDCSSPGPELSDTTELYVCWVAGEAEIRSGAILQVLSTLFIECLALPDEAKLADDQAQEIHLPPPPQHWDYKCLYHIRLV